MDESESEILINIGSTIDSIKFKNLPPLKYLELLAEKNSKIEFDLLDCGNIGWFSEYVSIGDNITKAGFETDFSIAEVTTLPMQSWLLEKKLFQKEKVK